MMKKIKEKVVKDLENNIWIVSVFMCKIYDLPIEFKVKVGQTDVGSFTMLPAALSEYRRIVNVLEKEKNGEI